MLPMRDVTTSEDRATQLLIWETLSLAICCEVSNPIFTANTQIYMYPQKNVNFFLLHRIYHRIYLCHFITRSIAEELVSIHLLSEMVAE